MKLDPQAFLEVTEATLLKEIGEKLRTFFDQESVEYRELEKDVAAMLLNGNNTLYEKIAVRNPRSAVMPVAQVNMVANVSFHLLAQQLAVFFSTKPEINKDAVFQTTFDNIRRLTAYYVKLLKEEGQNEGHGEGPGGGSAD